MINDALHATRFSHKTLPFLLMVFMHYKITFSALNTEFSNRMYQHKRFR